MKSSIPASALFGFLNIVALTSQAAVWVGGSNNNDWNTGANWSPASVPNGATVVAQIDNSGTAILSSPAPNIERLRIGVNAGNSGTVILNSSLTTASGGASEIARSGRATLIINSGASVQSGGTFRVGILAGSNGIGIQNGGSLTSTGLISIAHSGTGSYTLSGGTLNAQSNFTIAGAVDGTGTYTQTSGTLTVGLAGSGGTFFVGQNGNGRFDLSGGKLIASGFTIAGGVSAAGVVNQSGGEIDLVNGPTPNLGGGVTVTERGSYNISGGSMLIDDLTVAGKFNISGNTANITIEDFLSLEATGEMKFTFNETGISKVMVAEGGFFNLASTITVDGSLFAGTNGTFTLIDALSFDAAPVINLVGFESGTSYDWNLETGNFSITVVPEPSTVALAFTAGLGFAAWYRRRRQANH